MIPQHYSIEEGILYAGEYPGAKAPVAALTRMRPLILRGVRTFVDLTAPADRLESYQESLDGLADEIGEPLTRIAMPIPDMGVPESPEAMRGVMNAIRESVREAPAVYIHCWGGIGRTGTVVGCWLRECGHDPESALLQVHHLFTTHMPKSRIIPESPQTREQRDYILLWKPETHHP